MPLTEGREGGGPWGAPRIRKPGDLPAPVPPVRAASFVTGGRGEPQARRPGVSACSPFRQGHAGGANGG